MAEVVFVVTVPVIVEVVAFVVVVAFEVVDVVVLAVVAEDEGGRH